MPSLRLFLAVSFRSIIRPKPGFSYIAFEDGMMRGECSYEIKNNELFSLLMIPFMPFFWPASRRETWSKETLDKASECFNLKQAH